MSSPGNFSTESIRPFDPVWKSPYILASMTVSILAILSMLLSVLVICRRLHLFRYCSLFLVEMAVGALTTEAIVHLLPALILTEDKHKKGMPEYFLRLGTITAAVCLLHGLDTASVVFFGRRQSTSHALEWREIAAHAAREVNEKSAEHGGHHNSTAAGAVAENEGDDSPPEEEGGGGGEEQAGQRHQSMDGFVGRKNVSHVGRMDEVLSEDTATDIDFVDDLADGQDVDDDDEDDDDNNDSEGNEKKREGRGIGNHVGFRDSVGLRDSEGEITIRQALRKPRLCLQPGPYRLCSILSAGSVLHSFADGVAIGAAFSKGWESGLHLSISVGMHELSHKVADFAVLTASGFTMPALILLNLVYWLSSFIGLLIAVPLSMKSDSLRAWTMTVATAVFVYISLVTMSSMVRRNYLPRHISAFIIGNLGMTTGFILIILSSLFEFYV